MSPQTRESMDPSALPVAIAARMLSRAGERQISEAELQADIEAGAPTNSDGTLHLVHYSAWLVFQLAGTGEEAE